MITHKTLTVFPFERGPLATIGYLVVESVSQRAIVIDVPLDSADAIATFVKTREIMVSDIIITHGHWDHTGDAARLSELLGAPLSAHHHDTLMLERPQTYGFQLPAPLRAAHPERMLDHGDTVACGETEFLVLHVPGHTPGHIALVSASNDIAFAGDVLFRGSVGRSDLPGGSYDRLMHSITSVLFQLPDETVVYPGHGPSTTIGEERRTNIWVQDYLDHFST